MALFLSRKLGQRIIINGNITIEVVEFKGKNVKLAFNFPDGCSVLREEIIHKAKESNQYQSYKKVRGG